MPLGECRTISPPANGRTYVSGTTVGYTVTYYCNPEYKLIGLSSRTCQENGEWSGAPPSCSRKLCITIMTLMLLTGYVHKDVYTHKQQEHYAWCKVENTTSHAHCTNTRTRTNAHMLVLVLVFTTARNWPHGGNKIGGTVDC